MFGFHLFGKHKQDDNPYLKESEKIEPLREVEWEHYLDRLRRHEEAMEELRDDYENVDNDFILDDYDRDDDW